MRREASQYRCYSRWQRSLSCCSAAAHALRIRQRTPCPRRRGRHRDLRQQQRRGDRGAARRHRRARSSRWATTPTKRHARPSSPNCYDPTWGRHKARTKPSPGNHEYYTRRRGRLLRLLRRRRRRPGEGLLQLRPGRLAHHRDQQQLRLHGRRLRRRLGAGAVAARRPRGPPGDLHAGLLAPPALQLRQQHGNQRVRCSRSGRRSTTTAPTWC